MLFFTCGFMEALYAWVCVGDTLTWGVLMDHGIVRVVKYLKSCTGSGVFIVDYVRKTVGALLVHVIRFQLV